MRQGIPTFFFPTTTMIVDDQITFLNAIKGALGDHFPIISTDTPVSAIETVRKNGIESSIGDTVISIMEDDRRLGRISTVVSDYRMPEMTGIELVKQLKPHPVKKVILTGQMDNGSALTLFNDQLIDRYIEKAHDDMMDELRTYLTELQIDVMHQLSANLASNDSGFQALSGDQAFCVWFGNYREQNAFIEYYRVPEGFLVVDRDGAVSLLLIYTQNQLDELQEQARSQYAAPESVVEKMTAREVIFHPASPVIPVSADEGDWDNMLHPSRQVLGDRDVYFYSLIDDTAPYPDRVTFSLEDQLRALDDEAFL